MYAIRSYYVGQVVRRAIFGIIGQFSKSQLNKDQPREANELCRMNRHALVESNRVKVADNQAVHGNEILIEMQSYNFV